MKFADDDSLVMIRIEISNLYIVNWFLNWEKTLIWCRSFKSITFPDGLGNQFYRKLVEKSKIVHRIV